VSAAHRRYILLEQGLGAAIFNFLLNGAIAWLLFRRLETVPLWGAESIAGDTIGTSLLLPFLTCLIVTRLARRALRAGRLGPLGWTRVSHPVLRWLPQGTAARGGALAAICLVALAPPTLAGLAALGVESLRLWPFVAFKASFAAAAAAVVTPIVALWAIAEPAPLPACAGGR
jgi:hypothetical protein